MLCQIEEKHLYDVLLSLAVCQGYTGEIIIEDCQHEGAKRTFAKLFFKN